MQVTSLEASNRAIAVLLVGKYLGIKIHTGLLLVYRGCEPVTVPPRMKATSRSDRDSISCCVWICAPGLWEYLSS